MYSLIEKTIDQYLRRENEQGCHHPNMGRLATVSGKIEIIGQPFMKTLMKARSHRPVRLILIPSLSVILSNAPHVIAAQISYLRHANLMIRIHHINLSLIKARVDLNYCNMIIVLRAVYCMESHFVW